MFNTNTEEPHYTFENLENDPHLNARVEVFIDLTQTLLEQNFFGEDALLHAGVLANEMGFSQAFSNHVFHSVIETISEDYMQNAQSESRIKSLVIN